MNNSRNDGFLEGNGIIILILFILLFGMNGGGLFGGNGAFTRAEMYDGLSTQDIQNSLNTLSSSVYNGFAGVNHNILGGVNQIQLGMNNGFNSVNSNFQNLASQMASCCCDLKTTIHGEGEQTRALIQQNVIQDLRDKLADKDREALATGLVTAQTIQTNNLEEYMRKLINGCGCNA